MATPREIRAIKDLVFADKATVGRCVNCERLLIKNIPTGQDFHVLPIRTVGGQDRSFCYPFNAQYTAKRRNYARNV